MSRAQLVRAANRIGVPLTIVVDGRRGPKTTEYLRICLLEACYGPNLGIIQAKSVADIERRILRAADCKAGMFGKTLRAAQEALRKGNEARAEYMRLRNLKRRRPVDEGRFYAAAREWFDVAHEAQDEHEANAAIQR